MHTAQLSPSTSNLPPYTATSRTGRSTDPLGTFRGSSSQEKGQAAPAQDQKSPPLLPTPYLSSTRDMWFPNGHSLLLS